MYPKFFIFKLANISNKDALSICKRLIRGTINKRNKELQHGLKELLLHNNKSLQKSLYTQRKKLSSLTRRCSLPISTANETITNLTQYELSQEESDLLEAGLYFSVHPDKIQKSQNLLPLKRFIVLVLTTLNLRKPKVR